MEINILKSNFLKAVNLAEKITAKNLNLPILSLFMISTQKGKIKISSTNLEIGFEIYSPAQIISEGKVIVSAKTISNLVANIKDENLNLKEDKNNFKITSSKSIAILKTGLLEDFPILPKIKKEESFLMTIHDLIQGLKSVSFAASFSNFKPEIASIYFYNKENEYIFAATDSFRLMEKKIYGKNNQTAAFTLLLPIKTSQELIRILEDMEDGEKEVEVCFNKNEFQVSNNDFIFFARLTEGNFVNYFQFIPKSFLGELVVQNNELINVLKTANIFLGRLNDIVLQINLKESEIEFQTSNSELGEFFSKIKVLKRGFENLSEETIKLTFNLKYLLEGINQVALSNTNSVFKISEEGKPMILEGEDDKNMLYLVMPMKL